MSNFKEEMMAKLAQQKQDFINGYINTNGEYPKCYEQDMHMDTVFAMRRLLEARIVKLQDQHDRSEIKGDYVIGQKSSLMDLLEYLDEYVERQVSSAEDSIAEPHY
jgi:hypothetical protein